MKAKLTYRDLFFFLLGITTIVFFDLAFNWRKVREDIKQGFDEKTEYNINKTANY